MIPTVIEGVLGMKIDMDEIDKAVSKIKK